MANDDTLDIAKKLIATEDALYDLYDATKSKAKKAQISAQVQTLRKQIKQFIGKAIDESTAEYAAATKQLAKASAQVKKAIDDIKFFEQAIAAVAEAAAAVAAVAATV